MSALLELKGLRGGYGQVEVLRGVDLCVNAGETVALQYPTPANMDRNQRSENKHEAHCRRAMDFQRQKLDRRSDLAELSLVDAKKMKKHPNQTGQP